jgi:hypothetical protein
VILLQNRANIELLQWTLLIDAVRISDNTTVVLKRVETDREELTIGQYLSSFSDPRNICVPILDAMPLPGTDAEAIIVMPLLYDFEYLPFRRFGEVTEAFRQFLKVGGYFTTATYA